MSSQIILDDHRPAGGEAVTLLDHVLSKAKQQLSFQRLAVFLSAPCFPIADATGTTQVTPQCHSAWPLQPWAQTKGPQPQLARATREPLLLLPHCSALAGEAHSPRPISI